MQKKILSALSILGIVGMLISLFALEQKGVVLYIMNPVCFFLISVDSVVPNLDEIIKTTKLRIMFSILLSSLLILPLLLGLKNMGIINYEIDLLASIYLMASLGCSAYLNFRFGPLKSKNNSK
jgi:hypothetical protein